MARDMFDKIEMPKSKKKKITEIEMGGEEMDDEEDMFADAEVLEEELESPLADLDDADLIAEVKKRGLTLDAPAEEEDDILTEDDAEEDDII